MTVILDAGALIAIDRGDRMMGAIVKRERKAGRVPASHGGVIEAAVALLARDGDEIYTSDPRDIEGLCRSVNVSVDIIRV